ncbi:hypothetical protein SAMN05443575_1599 [Jatrophihabitans endophyticus]|uniref:Uncharacterized protein n=1 Tax=Jatrophihabitans endophyticus TaxID=1206085 RepID=A0A1M5HQ76_9ACTN|nr:hypothetical protein [Jatrophihabitans endophyticus]SHG18103.1 hypothetical protein SAMN05443575_1599 [Jatrophihabitans endophyticus]
MSLKLVQSLLHRHAPGRTRSRWVAICAIALTLTGIAFAGPAQAATGSYSFTSWNNRSAVLYGNLADGDTFAPPATVPSTATVTGLSGRVDFANISSQCPGACPPQATATAFACLDVNDTQCFQLGTNNSSFPTRIIWNIAITPGNYPAATSRFHFAFVISNGTTKAINPAIYLAAGGSKNFTVSYSY